MKNKKILYSIIALTISSIITLLIYLITPYSFKISYNGSILTKKTNVQSLSKCDDVFYYSMDNKFDNENFIVGNFYQIKKNNFYKILNNQNLEIIKYKEYLSFLSTMYINSDFRDIFNYANIFLFVKNKDKKSLELYEKNILKILYLYFFDIYDDLILIHPNNKIMYENSILVKSHLNILKKDIIPFKIEYLLYNELFNILCFSNLKLLDLRKQNLVLLISYFLSIFLLIYVLLISLSSNNFIKTNNATGK